jgi:hypothetical protein
MENLYIHCDNCSMDDKIIKNGYTTTATDFSEKSIGNYYTFIWNNKDCSNCTINIKNELDKIKGVFTFASRDAFILQDNEDDKKTECRCIIQYNNLVCEAFHIFVNKKNIIKYWKIGEWREKIFNKNNSLCIGTVGTLIFIKTENNTLFDTIEYADLYDLLQEVLIPLSLQLVPKYPIINAFVVEPIINIKKAIKK